jgi:iron(III) transport system ATP-binding protein
LRLAAGIERPTAGRILIDGREVAGPAGFVPPERRGVGLMFQDFALFPHLDVLSNVGYGLARLPKEAQREAAMAGLKRVGLAGHAGLYPHELSGGEQQRVALARAIAPRPRVLLMDEPFSGLDARLRDDVRDETLAVLRETRSTCVIVTHDPEEAMRMADRIALMRAGQIVQIGTPRELYDRPVDLFATRFFCSTNEIGGRVRGGRVETPVGSYPAPGLAEGADAVVCVRPQAVRLRPAGLCIPARLLSRRYLGEVDHVEVAVPGLDTPLKARLRGGFEARPRTDVGLEIDPAGVLVFAA